MKNKLLKVTSVLLGIIEGVVLLIFGILIATLNKSPNDTFNVLVGIILIIVCAITLVMDIVKNKTVMTESTAVNIAMISLAVIAFWDKAIPVEHYLAYFVIALGAYMIIEMVLSLIFKRKAIPAIISGLFGIGLVVVGVLFLTNDTTRHVVYIIVGILLIITAILILLKNVLALVLISKKDKDQNVIDAKISEVNE